MLGRLDLTSEEGKVMGIGDETSYTQKEKAGEDGGGNGTWVEMKMGMEAPGGKAGKGTCILE